VVVGFLRFQKWFDVDVLDFEISFDLNFWQFRQFLAIFGNFWQFLAIFGNFWQFLAIFGNFWLLFTKIGRNFIKFSAHTVFLPGWGANQVSYLFIYYL
jgi:hypothetical protein